MTKDLVKPTSIKTEAYDWHEVNTYLIAKYPTWKEKSDDIWSLLCENTGFHNGSIDSVWPDIFEDFMDLWEDDNDTDEAWDGRMNEIQLGIRPTAGQRTLNPLM